MVIYYPMQKRFPMEWGETTHLPNVVFLGLPQIENAHFLLDFFRSYVSIQKFCRGFPPQKPTAPN